MCKIWTIQESLFSKNKISRNSKTKCAKLKPISTKVNAEPRRSGPFSGFYFIFKAFSLKVYLNFFI